MNKRTPRITSLIFQGAFSLVCILNIILCTIHRQNFDTDFGRRCADIALDLTFILFLFLLIALPTSLLLNIIARFPNDEPQKKRRLWKLWTVLSPAFYVILWFVSLGVFISSTGGVWYTASFLSTRANASWQKRCQAENPRFSRVFFVFCRFSHFFENRILRQIKRCQSAF